MVDLLEAASSDDADAFPFVLHEAVRFNDCDPLGHANNALFSTYIEQARIAILRNFHDFILARVEIDFRSPLTEGEELAIRSRCASVGTTSFVLEHRVTAGGRLVAEAVSVMVSYDYSLEASTPVSPEVVALLCPVLEPAMGGGGDASAAAMADGGHSTARDGRALGPSPDGR
jgi:acyl-CoA thioester hydrolase